MREFDFIRSHLASIAGEGAEHLQDDCAWLPDGEGWQVISTDTSIEGVHFPMGMHGASASERAVRVALSDLAAKGADITGIFVNFSFPNTLADKWLVALAQGLSEAGQVFGAPLLGGDTTRHEGPLVITVTAIGKAGRKILRSGASVGDHVWVSGDIGDAALGLRYMLGDVPLSNPTGADLYLWEEAFLRPQPRFDCKSEITQLATGSIDVSDGLIADAGHVARASDVAVHLQADLIPVSDTSKRYIDGDTDRHVELLTAGDDYQILICAKPEAAKWLYDSPFVFIGTVEQGAGVQLTDGSGQTIPIERQGFSH